MQLNLATDLNMPAARATGLVRTTALLVHVAAPLQTFEPIDPPAFPIDWTTGAYLVRLRFLGLIPIGTQWIDISFPVDPQAPAGSFRLRDNGRGDIVSRWDHLIRIEPLDDNRCRCRDTVDIDAGVLTPFVCAFAWVFYRHRQRRWRAL